jgi:hypothetical protein
VSEVRVTFDKGTPDEITYRRDIEGEEDLVEFFRWVTSLWRMGAD